MRSVGGCGFGGFGDFVANKPTAYKRRVSLYRRRRFHVPGDIPVPSARCLDIRLSCGRLLARYLASLAMIELGNRV